MVDLFIISKIINDYSEHYILLLMSIILSFILNFRNCLGLQLITLFYLLIVFFYSILHTTTFISYILVDHRDQ